MLLINGEVYENDCSSKLIKEVRKRMLVTLAKEPLDVEVVLEAADQLAKEVLDGNMELGEFERYDICKIANSFCRKELEKKLLLELLHLPTKTASGKKLMLAPLGTILHIAAGNVDALPAYSVLEGLLAGNINLLKLPSADDGLSISLLKKLMEYAPILKEYIYVFDTPSSDLDTIRQLMNMVNAIVTWGSDEAITAVRQNAPVNTKLIEWGHKLSFAYIKDLSVPDMKLEGLARHLFDTNQVLCSSCQVIYVNTTKFDEVKTFGERFASSLQGVESSYEIPRMVRGKITIELLTRELENLGSSMVCYRNEKSSVICSEDSRLEPSLLFGTIYVKPLLEENMIKELYDNKSYLQTVGIYPNEKSLREKLIRLGVTKICEIDKMTEFDMTTTHDGVFALQQYSRLVEYKE